MSSNEQNRGDAEQPKKDLHLVTNVHSNLTFDSDKTPNSPSFFEYCTEEKLWLRSGANSEGFSPDVLPLDFANYKLVKKLGEGGAGIVFLATPNPSHSLFSEYESVALKMIRPEIVANPRAVQRFEKESRLHAEVESPFVTKHLEFGTEQGSYFIASEFAQGISLDRAIEKLSKLPAKTSLRIIVDLLKALAAMHSAGLIHRDVKPANIMAGFQNLDADEEEIELGEFVIAKLTDFGLARHVEQSQSLAMTRQQTLLGTPVYMAPEQHFESRRVDARADIYSVGVTLYQMLAGHPPFDSEETIELAEMHRVERPMPLTIARPGTSEGINNLVMKALEKDPDLRYQDAREMLADVERILADQPISLRMYPETPDAFHPAVKCYDFQWELDADVKQLWPLVSDTDRFNRALGLPAPNFNYDHSGDRLKVFADVKFKGMKFRWREHPFQWICEREMSVLREFESGPFEWLASTVELHPMAGRRTRLIHRFQIKPRGWFGKLFTSFQFGVATKRSLDKVYRGLENIANDTSCGYTCDFSFGASPKFSNAQAEILEDRVGRLAREVGNRQLAKELGDYLKRVADPASVRIRPFELGLRLDCTKDQSLQICFAGVKVGLLNLSWDIICPVCRIAADNTSSLEKIESHTHCKVCNIQFETSFSQSVEAIFGVHPEIRDVELKTYCIGGPYHAPHVLAQNRLLANQHVDVGVVLKKGQYEVTGPQLGQQWMVEVEDDGPTSRAAFIIGKESDGKVAAIGSGQACLAVDNQSSLEVLVRLEQASSKGDALTADVASRHPLFRELFPAEVITVEHLVGLSNVYLLAIRHTKADELVDQIGDMQVRENWNQMQKLFSAGRGECKIVECTHESLIASFGLLDDLLKALLSLVAVEAGGVAIPMSECCFAICAGEVMTGISANQPSTFGKTVRDTKKILAESLVGELRSTDDVFQSMQQSQVWKKQNCSLDEKGQSQSEEQVNKQLLDYFSVSDDGTQQLTKLLLR